MLCAIAPSVAHAQTPPPTTEPAPETTSLPGSPAAPGLSLSPEAPPTPTSSGGRAPAFGTPSDPEAWVFRISGRISGFGQTGIGRTPSYEPPSTGLSLHTPPRLVGRSPIYAGPGATLNFEYGSPMLMAFVSLETSADATEWRGYYAGQWGPRIRTAYVAVNPPSLGDLRLRVQVGAFPANYGAPGPWGWGLFGPVLAVHGYGGLATGNYELDQGLNLYMEVGVAGVPEIDEAFARGTYTDWPEVGLSSIVPHAHLGISLENKYFAKLHLARAIGVNLRRYLDDDPTTPQVEHKPDGHIDVAALETRVIADPFGQLGVTAVYWNFKDATQVHDGIWWGLDWTAGGREMTNKFLGPLSNGNGQIAAVSIEYDFSLRRILVAPQSFDGNGQDLRVALAFEPYWTLKSLDPSYNRTSGYYVGASLEHVIYSWLSGIYYLFGESRDAATYDIAGIAQRGRWSTFSGTVGLALHYSWQSQDRIVLAYSRYFYSSFTDNNPALPLDRDVFTLGGSLAF